MRGMWRVDVARVLNVPYPRIQYAIARSGLGGRYSSIRVG